MIKKLSIFKKIFMFSCSVLFVLIFSLCADASEIVKEIKKRGYLNCGIYDTGNIFQNKNIENLMCDIVSSAILGDDSNVNYIPLIDDARWDALSEKAIDILYASPTWTVTRDIALNINFTPVYIFDSQILITLKSYGIKSIDSIKDGTGVCVVDNNAMIDPLTVYMKKHNKNLNIIKLNSSKNVIRALYHGKCSMMSEETEIVKTMMEASDEINPLDTVTVQPIAGVVRKENDDLYKIAFWAINGLLRAEKKNINMQNIDYIKQTSQDTEILFMLGKIPGIGEPFGLNDDWLYNIIKKYGNYSELLHTATGKNPRIYHLIQNKKNSLSRNGGMLFSYPFID